MVRVSLFFIAGILLGIFCPEITNACYITWSIVILMACYGVLWFVRTPAAKSMRGIAGLTAILLMGMLNVQRSTASSRGDHVLQVGEKIVHFRGVVARYGEEKERSWRYEVDVNAVRTDTGWHKVDSRILLYVSKTPLSPVLRYGDVVLVQQSPEVIPLPANPGEFDMQTYQRYRNIYHRCFVRPDVLKVTGHHEPSRFIALAIAARSWASAQLRQFVTSPREQATITALVLGVTDGLDDELLAAYSATGAMHVLAVSGLHVSIIYWIILLVCKPLDRTAAGKWTLAIGSVFLLWAYAFITGWSPSVLRAVMMFTFVALSRPWKQSTMIYNTLASSAFCLLLYDPYFIMSVGFQLSYLAVFGIVWLQRPLYNLWEPQNRFVDECWKVTSVSIAAQVTTLPLTLYCFHQFPVYFLVANLLVIPASFVVLVGGLALLPLSLVPFLAHYFGIAMEWVVRIMNEAIFITERLPHSTIDSIYLNAPQAFALAVILISFCLLLLRRRARFLYIAAAATLVFAALQWQHHVHDVRRGRLVVYDVGRHTAIDWIANGHIFPIADSLLRQQPKLVDFHQSAFRLMAGGKKLSHDGVALVHRQGYSIAVLDGLVVLNLTSRKARLPEHLVVDWVVVSNGALKSLPDIRERLKFGRLVIDSSNSLYFAEQLMREAQALRIDVWSVQHSGALVHTTKL